MNPRSVWAPKGLVAVLDTSVHVAAALSGDPARSPAQLVQEAAGYGYDSFTSPDILNEVEEVLRRLGFRKNIRRWIDQFGRMSRQVNPRQLVGDYSALVGHDVEDDPIIKTALSVLYHDPEGQEAVEMARHKSGCYIVTTNTRDFPEGRYLYGWTCIRPHRFVAVIDDHAASIAASGPEPPISSGD